jgi:hypothetical protein
MQSVKEVATQITMGLVTDREKAIALHNYVRDNVKFGFTKRFDAADPSYTLSCGIGHCNPKSRLMVSLFREAGLESHQHFVIIPSDILKDAFPPSRRWLLPAQLSHGFVEVNVGGTWCAIDSYSIDTALLKGAEAALSKHGRSFGYGVCEHATNNWDGQSDAFSQFDRRMMLEDHGRVDDIDSYFRGRTYRHQVLGIRFNAVFPLTGDFVLPAINSHIEGIRSQAAQ